MSLKKLKFFRHFAIMGLYEVPIKSEFRYKDKWYEKISSNLAQETLRNKNCKFNWLDITIYNSEFKVALLLSCAD